VDIKSLIHANLPLVGVTRVGLKPSLNLCAILMTAYIYTISTLII